MYHYAQENEWFPINRMNDYLLFIWTIILSIFCFIKQKLQDRIIDKVLKCSSFLLLVHFPWYVYER